MKSRLVPIVVVLGVIWAVSPKSTGPVAPSDRAIDTRGRRTSIDLKHPFDGAVFPKDMAAPLFWWKAPESVPWFHIRIRFADGRTDPIGVQTRDHAWRPTPRQWERFKEATLEAPAQVDVIGFESPPTWLRGLMPPTVLAGARISLSTSPDPVGAPIFYREVTLPFKDAVRDPSRIRWRFGPVSDPAKPPVVLENLPVCGNCHSFSADGETIGMDIDSANDKGSYIISPVSEEMVFDKAKVITWADFERDSGEKTFGLLARISPDGRYAVSMVKDRHLTISRKDLMFSQLFFPVKGILAVYDRVTGEMNALSGANDPTYVNANASFSPDQSTVVFARAPAHKLPGKQDRFQVLLSDEEATEFIETIGTLRYDLYTVPFNDGKGGEAIPLEGASDNSKSNYFAKYSPDGKWIVYCRANSYMLLQPDSELWIVPAGGGKSRRLECNTSRMNSWHSWSPNSKWLVFSSKVFGAYTRLFLTHIDEDGRSTPPVCLDYFTSDDRAANIPEFVNNDPRAIRRIRQAFLDHYSFLRAAHTMGGVGDYEGAEKNLRKALAMDDEQAYTHNYFGTILTILGKRSEAFEHYERALELDPELVSAWFNRGNLLAETEDPEGALEDYGRALALDPDHTATLTNRANVLFAAGRTDEAIRDLEHVLEIRPEDVRALGNLGYMRLRSGDREGAGKALEACLAIASPDWPERERTRRLLESVQKAQGVEEPVEAALGAAPSETSAPPGEPPTSSGFPVDPSADPGR